MSWKKLLLVTCKVLRLFVNTLTADDKCSLLSRDNLVQPIQMDLSQKQKTVFELFCSFFKSTSKFEHFQKKMTLVTYVFPKLLISKDVVRKMSKKSRFRGSLYRQHGKWAKTLIQSERQHLHYIH